LNKFNLKYRTLDKYMKEAPTDQYQYQRAINERVNDKEMEITRLLCLISK